MSKSKRNLILLPANMSGQQYAWNRSYDLEVVRSNASPEGLVQARLPNGWKLKRWSGYESWRLLMDRQGRIRCKVFFPEERLKDSYMDMPEARYTVCTVHGSSETHAEVLDAGRPVYFTQSWGVSAEDPAKWGLWAAARSAAEEWCNERFPAWRDPWAYWKD
jgi:hypothetical protein